MNINTINVCCACDCFCSFLLVRLNKTSKSYLRLKFDNIHEETKRFRQQSIAKEFDLIKIFSFNISVFPMRSDRTLTAFYGC